MASTKTTNNTTWVTPHTFTTGELITKSTMDTYLSGELTALKTPASFYIKIDEAADYSTSSTSFATIGSTELSATITTAGGTVWVSFIGVVKATANNTTSFDLLVDGAAYAGNDGIVQHYTATATVAHIAFTVAVTGLSAGSHTFALQWKVSTSTTTLFAGAGTAGNDVHPYFQGIETG